MIPAPRRRLAAIALVTTALWALSACSPAAKAPKADPGAAPAQNAQAQSAGAAFPDAPFKGQWSVDSAQSAIQFKGAHAGKPFIGSFWNWRAEIDFDPADLSKARAFVQVDLASAKTGDKSFDAALPDKEWFDVQNHPVAVFEAARFTALGGDLYRADGELKIKDVGVPVSLNFMAKIEGDRALVTGSTKLDRLALDLGRASDLEAEWVSKDIAVEITLAAKKSAP